MDPLNVSNQSSDKRARRMHALKNTIFATLTSLSDVLLFALLVVAGRLLGAENFGIFNSALALTAILMFATDLGLDNLAIREISVDRSTGSKLMGSVLVWKTLAVMVILVVYLPIVYALWFDSPVAILVYLLCLAAILRSFNLTFRSFLHSYERFDIESVLVISERIATFLLGVLALWSGHGVIGLAVVFVVVRTGLFITYLLVIHLWVSPIILALRLREMLAFQIMALPLGIALIIRGIYLQADILLLSFLRTDAEVGLFSASFKIQEGLLVVSMIITHVMYPRLSEYFVHDRFRHHDYFYRMVKYLTIVSFPILAIGFLYSDEIILLLYGKDFATSGAVLAILLASLVFVFNSTALIVVLRSNGNQMSEMHILTLALLTKVVAGIALIPFFGIYGAAVAAMIAAAVMLVLAMIRLHQLDYKLTDMFKNIAKMAASTIIIFLLILILPISSLPVEMTVLCCLYLAAIFAFGLLDKYEKEVIMSLPPFRFLGSIFGSRS